MQEKVQQGTKDRKTAHLGPSERTFKRSKTCNLRKRHEKHIFFGTKKGTNPFLFFYFP